MACISIHVGQCGNQLGTAILDRLVDEGQHAVEERYARQVSGTFFRQAIGRPRAGSTNLPHARCVLLDMESKVVDECLERTRQRGLYALAPSQCVTKEEGSANNWAVGYVAQGPSRREAVEEQLRREVEAGGATEAFHVVHSAAGGTGSGVGCLVSEVLRDCYARVPLIHSAVLPFRHGEVTTQCYNAAFTLAALADSADLTLLLSNDDVAAQLARQGAGGGVPALQELNTLMSELVASALLPGTVVDVLADSAHDQQRSRGRMPSTPTASIAQHPKHMADLIEAVALDPSRRFVEGQVFAGGATRAAGWRSGEGLPSPSWSSCIAEGLRFGMATRRAGVKADTCALLLRGPTVNEQGGGMGELSALLHDAAPALVATECSPYQHHAAHATVLRNGERVGQHAARVALEAERMFSARAFVHHFQRHGIEACGFEEAISACWHLAQSYGVGSPLEED